MSGIFSRFLSAHRDRTAALKALGDVLKGSVCLWDIISPSGKAPENKDKAELVKRYQAWVYACANRNAAAITGATLRLYATQATGESRAGARFGHKIGRQLAKHEKARLKRRMASMMNARIKSAAEIEEIEEHPILDLFQNVNDFHNWNDLSERLSLFLDCTGDCFWHVIPYPAGHVLAGLPQSVWVLPSQWVRIVPDTQNFIRGYLYGRQRDKMHAFEPDEIIHFSRTSLSDMWYGMSRIEGAYWAVTGYESMEKFEKSLADTRGMKDIMIKYTGGRLDGPQRRDLMTEWGRALRNASKTGTPIIGDQDFEIETVTWSPRELAFMQGRKWRKEEIITAFGQHPAMYAENANTANIKGAIYLWEEYDITPTLRRIEQKLNEKLVPRYQEPRLFLAFDPVVDSDREQDRSDNSMLLQNGYPINRVLVDMGRDPIDGGDIGYVNSSSVPLGTEPQQEPPNQTRTLALPAIDRATSTSAGPDAGRYKGVVIMEKAGEVEITGGSVGPMTASEAAMSAGVARVFSDQAQRAIAEAAKAEAAEFAWVASDEWAEEIYRLTHGHVREAVVAGGKRGSRVVGVTMTDFIDRPHVQQAIREHSFAFARSINKGTADALQAAVEKGVMEGASIPELKKSIEELFDGWKGWRAERIARTESARAFSAGEEMQWGETGMVSGKAWDANGDACPFCLEMHGRIVSLGQPFLPEGSTQEVDFEDRKLRLSHNYMNVDGPPLHPHCRCDLRPVMVE